MEWLPWPLCTRFRIRVVSHGLEGANWTEKCNPSAMTSFTLDLNILVIEVLVETAPSPSSVGLQK